MPLEPIGTPFFFRPDTSLDQGYGAGEGGSHLAQLDDGCVVLGYTGHGAIEFFDAVTGTES